MLQYSLRRILGMIPMLILISFVVFSLAKMMPGDPFGEKSTPVIQIQNTLRKCVIS